MILPAFNRGRLNSFLMSEPESYMTVSVILD
jgi:hypothetical protein